MVLKATKQPPEVSSVPKANKKPFGGCTEQEVFLFFFHALLVVVIFVPKNQTSGENVCCHA